MKSEVRNISASWKFKLKRPQTQLPFHVSFLVVLQGALIFGFVVYVTWQNTFLASDWWLISLRDIDDFAVNGGTEDLRRALASGDWVRSLTFFEYAYGIGFWLLMVGLTLPFHLLEVGELQIFMGRTLSLGAVLATSIVVALIGRRLYPRNKLLWLVAVGVGFLTPMSLINGTKMHVNGWMTLFGALAILLLVGDKKLSRKALYAASFFMGLAVGFKLTALVLLPVFLSTVFVRRRDVGAKHVWGSYLAVPFFAIITGFPVLLLSPLMPQAANYVLGVFNLFGGIGSGTGVSPVDESIAGLGFLGNPIIIFALLGLLVLLTLKSKEKFESPLAWTLPLSIAATFTVSWVAITLAIPKPSIYLATYSLSASVFLSLGVFAIPYLFSRQGGQLVAGLIIVLGNLFLSTQFSATALGPQNYAAVASSPSVERKINAAKEIAIITDGITRATTVLMDSSSVFPLSRIDGEVDMTFSFGNLTSFSDSIEKGGKFDFIVLDSHSYFGMPNVGEEAARKSLREDGEIWSINYELIYSNYGTLVYRLVGP